MISDSFLFTVQIFRGWSGCLTFEACIGVLGIQDVCHFPMQSILLPEICNTVGGGGGVGGRGIMVMSWYICAVGIFHTHAPYSCNTNFPKLYLFMYNHMNLLPMYIMWQFVLKSHLV